MTRRVRRHKAFEILVHVKDEAFLRPPREAQRNWLLNRLVKETADDLVALDEAARGFVRGGEPVVMSDRDQARLADEEIMEDWQIPVMKAMAEAITDTHGDILEIGFGRGVASSLIQEQQVRSHTIIECNAHVIERFAPWKSLYPGRQIRLVEGMWQDVVGGLDAYDGIFFHTYPLSEQDFAEQVVQSVTFAAHFFPKAERLLRPGGRFSYLTNEADSLSRGHQRLLFQHFSSFSLSRVTDLPLPDDTRDAHWSAEMVIVKAIK
jgi:guanidinoacetate N-methyltransferase